MKRLLSYNYINPWKEIFYDHRTPSPLSMLSKFYTSVNVLTDRFNILNDDCEYNILSTNTNIQNILDMKRMFFDECCRRRTEEIISYASLIDKDIYVLWSGGVDSTCVACSFLMNETLDRKRFHIILNDDSIFEYPLFYTMLVNEHIDIINVRLNLYKIRTIVNDNVAVNGICGDQLDGFNLNKPKFKSIGYFDDWKDGVNTFLSNNYTKDSIDNVISSCEDYAHKLKIDLSIFGEFIWLFNFSLKWNYLVYYLKCLYVNPDTSIAFFDTDYFSNFALFNYHKRRLYKQNSSYLYKTEWKKIIYSFTKDEDYFLNKGKESPLFLNIPETFFGMTVVDDSGYHLYDDTNETVVKNILLPFVKPKYQGCFDVIRKH